MDDKWSETQAWEAMLNLWHMLQEVTAKGAGVTFEQAHQLLLDDLDKAYQELRKIHADLNWIYENTYYGELWDNFEFASKQLFALKSTWYVVKNLAAKQNHETNRTERDGPAYAVTMTELEKVMGYYNTFVREGLSQGQPDVTT